MSDPRPIHELDGLRKFLAMLVSGELTLSRGGEDETAKEILILEREIAHLEIILTRAKAGGVELGRPRDKM